MIDTYEALESKRLRDSMTFYLVASTLVNLIILIIVFLSHSK